jgi:formylglycine-generating enzyme required for sulfatase activity
VTVGRFRAALAQGFDPAELPVPNPAPLATSSTDDHMRRCTWTDLPLAGASIREGYPLNCISWTSARAFCQWLGGDFPSEAQWELAAAASGRALETRFPWGQEVPSCDRQVFSRLDQKITLASLCFDAGHAFGVAPIGDEYAGDVTPGGIVGLGGGVMEWTGDAYHAYGAFCWASAPLDDPRCVDDASGTRMARGGSWAGSSVELLAALRGREGGTEIGYAEIGFRCARPGRLP